MQRCELAEECCVCNVPFCPYWDDDFTYDDLIPREFLDDTDCDEDEEGW